MDARGILKQSSVKHIDLPSTSSFAAHSHKSSCFYRHSLLWKHRRRYAASNRFTGIHPDARGTLGRSCLHHIYNLRRLINVCLCVCVSIELHTHSRYQNGT